MVLTPEPHDVIARFVHPVTIAEDRCIDPRPHVGRQPVAIGAHQPEQRDHHEIGAVFAPVDGMQRRINDAANRLDVIAAGGDHRQRAADAPGAETGAEGEGRLFALVDIGIGCFRRNVVHESCVDDAGDRSRSRTHRDPDAVIPVRNARRSGDRQRGLPGLQHGVHFRKRGALVAMAFDGNMHRQVVCRGRAEDQFERRAGKYIPRRVNVAHQCGQTLRLLPVERHRQHDGERHRIDDLKFEKPDDVALRQIFAEQQHLVIAHRKIERDVTAAFDIADKGFETDLFDAADPDAHAAAGAQPEMRLPCGLAAEGALQPALYVGRNMPEAGEFDAAVGAWQVEV
ncbi:hypothetical protein D3C86_1243090 [compost metagenome]